MKIDTTNSIALTGLPVAEPVATRVHAKVEKTGAIDNRSIQSAVKAANEIAASNASEIEFSIDNESGGTIVRVLDKRTKEVIRQMPSEAVLRLRRALDSLRGLFFDQKI